jgi:hypothetical protein
MKSIDVSKILCGKNTNFTHINTLLSDKKEAKLMASLNES